jgi:hypothetical protein
VPEARAQAPELGDWVVIDRRGRRSVILVRGGVHVSRASQKREAVPTIITVDRSMNTRRNIESVSQSVSQTVHGVQSTECGAAGAKSGGILRRIERQR